jgi:hypothetical protein
VNTRKWLHVQARCSVPSSFTAFATVPTGSTAALSVPLLYTTAARLTESQQTVWSEGQFVPGIWVRWVVLCCAVVWCDGMGWGVM